jgi:hypothetical protein
MISHFALMRLDIVFAHASICFFIRWERRHRLSKNVPARSYVTIGQRATLIAMCFFIIAFQKSNSDVM